jgi:hypothetical protein
VYSTTIYITQQLQLDSTQVRTSLWLTDLGYWHSGPKRLVLDSWAQFVAVKDGAKYVVGVGERVERAKRLVPGPERRAEGLPLVHCCALYLGFHHVGYVFQGFQLGL